MATAAAPASPAVHPVLVAGAGIAGLAFALSLAGHGHDVTVIEAFDAPSEVGAGIQVPPNAAHVIARLGLLDALVQKAVKPHAVCLGDAVSGEIVFEMPVNLPGDELPWLTVHRASLHGVLYEAARRQPHITLLTGRRITGIRETADHVAVQMTHRGDREELAASSVIGADGMWSVVRNAVPGAVPPAPTGRIALRAVVPATAHSPADRVIAWMAPDSHLVTYPMRNAATRNLVAVTNGHAEKGSWSQSADRSVLKHLIARLAQTADAHLTDSAEWTAWPLAAVPLSSAWHSKRICLIGDAAHGLEPFAAQGAAMAIEDAHALASLMIHGDGVPAHAFSAWERARRGRIERVAKRTAFNRFTYHQSGPGRLVRNLVLRSRSAEAVRADMAWLYDYRA